MRNIRLLLLIAAATLAMGFQEDDPHAGQPSTCNNYRTNTHKCQCAKAMMCPMDDHGKKRPGSMDPDFYKEGPNKCFTFCRKEACNCVGPCTSRSVR